MFQDNLPKGEVRYLKFRENPKLDSFVIAEFKDSSSQRRAFNQPLNHKNLLRNKIEYDHYKKMQKLMSKTITPHL